MYIFKTQSSFSPYLLWDGSEWMIWSPYVVLFVCVEKFKAAEIVDESDRELIRVARGDVEDEEPKEKAHHEKKRSTEGKLT